MENDLNTEFFRATRLNRRLTRIRGISDEIMYLAVGDERAALIDTGLGIGDLRAMIAQLTDKPLTVLLTHAHVDHAMGASLFEDVCLNPADWPVYEDHRRRDKRMAYLRRFLGRRFSLVTDQSFVEAPPLLFRPLLPGDSFDLGGLTLEIFAAPGHSPGSSAILLRELRSLLLGDACNTLTILFDQDAPTIEAFRDSLLQLKEQTAGLYDLVLLSHGSGDGPADLIDSVIRVCEEIMAGSSEEIPFRFMEHSLVAAHRMSTLLTRSDGGSGNIVYDKNKVFRDPIRR